MIGDKALANSIFHWNVGRGDTGKGRMEHRSFESCGSLTQ
jgi:hypothetical protein